MQPLVQQQSGFFVDCFTVTQQGQGQWGALQCYGGSGQSEWGQTESRSFGAIRFRVIQGSQIQGNLGQSESGQFGAMESGQSEQGQFGAIRIRIIWGNRNQPVQGNQNRRNMLFTSTRKQSFVAVTYLWCVVMEKLPFLPEASFGLWVLCLPASVCVSVRPSVRQSLACPRDNSGPVQARITKLRPKMQKTLIKVTIICWGNRPRPSRSNLT